MQTSIAQIVALVVHGNAYFQNKEQADAFPVNHPTLKFCEFVKFVSLTRSRSTLNETPFAQDPASWLKELRRCEVYALRMINTPSGYNFSGVKDRMLVGLVGGGGRWLLETIGSNGSDFWEGRWEVGDKSRIDSKIWQVTYGRIAANQPQMTNTSSDLESLRQRLTENLTEISAFARHQKLDDFAQAFDTGLSYLAPAPPTALHDHDLLTADIPPTAVQLLLAAESSWVFGGMGSWNDLGFDGDNQRIYEDLSEDLYKLLNESIVSAANSTAMPADARPEPEPRKRSWWRFWD